MRRSVERSPRRNRAAAATKPEVQEALEVTWTLKGHLKNAQIAYLRVGALLAQVRDKKMYAALGHADMENYAQERLRLGRASLYRYLQVYDWVSRYHKEWLAPKPQGFIPDLADATDLIWIEEELGKTDIDPARKTALEGLRDKALDGSLRDGEVAQFRRQGQKQDSLKSFLSQLRLLRRRGAHLAKMPPQAIADLDDAIETIGKTLGVKRT
jgi:hypothetical protein